MGLGLGLGYGLNVEEIRNGVLGSLDQTGQHSEPKGKEKVLG